MDLKLKNKVAVVTGGASGIGLATAKLFADEGANLFLWDRADTQGLNFHPAICTLPLF